MPMTRGSEEFGMFAHDIPGHLHGSVESSVQVEREDNGSEDMADLKAKRVRPSGVREFVKEEKRNTMNRMWRMFMVKIVKKERCCLRIAALGVS